MTDIEKALENARKTRFRIDNMTASSYPVTEREKDVIALADAYRAEKKRADEATLLRDRFIKASCNLGAENARLREFIDKLKALKRYRFTNEVGGEYGRPYIFADDLEALTPSTPSHAGEIDPTHADYGCFKTRNEFPS